jgi:hypothetical protein
VLGDEHPDTLTSANNLAEAYRTGQLDKAIPLLEQTLTGRRRALGDAHSLTVRVGANLRRVKSAGSSSE